MRARRVTLVDVAERAAVSVATVSRALSGDPQISEPTQRRIRHIADELKYVPNVTARNLVRQSSATFGLMTPDVTDPIHGQLVTGFQQRAAERGYSVILANGFWDAGTERRAIREFSAHRVAASAVMGCVLPQRDVRRLLAPSPVLFIESAHIPDGGGRLDHSRGCVRPDEESGMCQVVDHLIDRGYRRVAYVPIGWGAGPMLRRDALTAALQARRRPPPTILDPGSAGLDGLAEVARQLEHGGFDVVVCCDDKTALTLMDELRHVGLTVPDDIGVVGFDDIPFARIANPRLTTVSQCSTNVGRQCADFLLGSVKTGTLPKSQLMPVSLIVRDTTPGRRRTEGAAKRKRASR